METIEKNGEFERYVVMLTDREEKEHRELRRRERERRRLEEGDAYQSEDESAIEEENEDSYDSETEEDLESEMNRSELEQSEMAATGGDPRSSTMRQKKRGTSSRLSDGMDVSLRFNALRFLAMNLKSQNETMQPQTANTQGGG